MKKEILERIKEKVHNLTTEPGVYKMLDIYGNIIYIGKAKNLKNRVSSYFLNTVKLPKVQQMVDNVYDFEYIITPSELEALNLESNLIHKHQPFYNILLKDGKAFPYIKIDYKSDYPKVQITRKVVDDGAMYFGPYFNKINITDLYKIINNSFKLRDCNLKINGKGNRECLNYHINNCLAPCTNKCTKEEYRCEVDKVINFLKGDLSQATQIITNKMNSYAEMEMFEKAIEMRSNLEAIKNINAQNITGLTKNTDMDILGFAENGTSAVISVAFVRGNKMVGLNNYTIIDASNNPNDIVTNFLLQYYTSSSIMAKNIVCNHIDESTKEWIKTKSGKQTTIYTGTKDPYKRLLKMANDNASEYLIKSIEKDKLHELKTIGAMKSLQKILGLTRLPKRIEGYDISNLGGTNTVASMVVFINGEKAVKHYRKFKIDCNGQNDFKNMHDILTRRFSELRTSKDISFSTPPDLILIDGGIIQLNFANEAMIENNFDFDMISLAEKNEEIYKIDGTKVILSKDNFALKLLQNVRDESHRFAITFQKSLRQKNNLISTLEKIPLVGKNKVNILFDHFKSIESIQKATINQLCSVPSIGKQIAQNIYNYFHKD